MAWQPLLARALDPQAAHEAWREVRNACPAHGSDLLRLLAEAEGLQDAVRQHLEARLGGLTAASAAPQQQQTRWAFQALANLAAAAAVEHDAAPGRLRVYWERIWLPLAAGVRTCGDPAIHTCLAMAVYNCVQHGQLLATWQAEGLSPPTLQLLRHLLLLLDRDSGCDTDFVVFFLEATLQHTVFQDIYLNLDRTRALPRPEEMLQQLTLAAPPFGPDDSSEATAALAPTAAPPAPAAVAEALRGRPADDPHMAQEEGLLAKTVLLNFVQERLNEPWTPEATPLPVPASAATGLLMSLANLRFLAERVALLSHLAQDQAWWEDGHSAAYRQHFSLLLRALCHATAHGSDQV
jgi:hypothetical protein